ncbi:NAD(P)-dependent oxidoreductase [Sphaerisporangium rhizosphaerae]|uniref:NAD(P)-dependent oxidoreductase n=1 Tax=Sphaerisporangium rhizosphaerae TaxID=2269375 RepID=A0ABW2NZS6_9ACTN
MRVAVLGMGNMGRAVAARLLAQGYHVTVWNRTPGRAAEVVESGAVEASSPRQAARDAEAVLMSLTDERAALEVMSALTGPGDGPPAQDTRDPDDTGRSGGPGGFSGSEGSGHSEGASGSYGSDGSRVVVDMSTVSPEASRRLRELAPGRRFLAAPILGAPQAVLSGSAAGLVGGDRALAERLEPIWSRLFSAHWYCGADPGEASAFKLLNNYLLMAGIAVLGEVVATAEAAGLDRTLLREVLRSWPTVAPGLHNRLDDLIAGRHEGWFATALGAKDVRLLTEVAESNGVSPPIARLVQRRYEEAVSEGWRDADITAVVELLRRRPSPP